MQSPTSLISLHNFCWKVITTYLHCTESSPSTTTPYMIHNAITIPYLAVSLSNGAGLVQSPQSQEEMGLSPKYQPSKHNWPQLDTVGGISAAMEPHTLAPVNEFLCSIKILPVLLPITAWHKLINDVSVMVMILDVPK
ncbi:hypothetical protein E2C01_030679 [Portunus trituberculatus]|uniref:Uncharacterized protein n=1 Tax=Portunus trituberculatus TaxID=210409 RepID=A0A5B7EUV2_PORTR|nr:hypothetical protein [Portunus trituberculatus]